MKKLLSLCIGLYVFLLFFYSPYIFAQKSPPKKLAVNELHQITFEPDPVVYAAISQDGKWIVYTSTRENFTDLWLRSTDPSVVMLPQRLTSDPANESYPAFSPDGRFIVYVGYGYDTKGDIYLIDREKIKSGPRRLTGRDTEDGAPAFSSDGKSIYYHQTPSDRQTRELAVLDRKTGVSRTLELNGDGSFPAVSPDGKYLAFVSHREKPSGDIFILNIRSGKVYPLTKSNAIDIFPSWSPDGRYIYFCRFVLDTNQDGRITPEDNSIIYRVKLNENLSEYAYPQTAFTYSAVEPQYVGDTLYFLSNYKGVTNLWALPPEGQIPVLSNVEQQYALAEEISNYFPPSPALALLGYYKVVEKFKDQEPFAGKAAYQVGRLYLEVGARATANKLFQIVIREHGDVQPEAALSLIEQTLINAHTRLQNVYLPQERATIINTTLVELDRISAAHEGQKPVEARVLIEKAQLLKDYAGDSESLVHALMLLEKVITDYSSQREYAAQAGVLRADIFSQTGQTDKVYQAYISVIDRYEDVEKWADIAVERIIELSEQKLDTDTQENRIELLRKIASQNKAKYPRLSMKALNRIGDIYYAENEWAQAKAAYQQVLDQFPVVTTQTASARLALAEISYREERYSQALSLYEKETEVRPYEDRIYQLARIGYIQKSLDAAESLFIMGEVPAARTIFKNLIDYNYSIVEAHRGYIKCAAAQKNITPVIEAYQKRLEKNPDDPTTLYAVALSLTYEEDEKSLKKAQKLIYEALSKEGQTEYFYQTLGYTFEVLETAYGEKGNLEKAVQAYQKAYFLNDHDNNPRNAANLLLNIGNGYFLLGQYTRAFHYYQKRAESDMPFDNVETEILFYRRFAISAFQTGDFEQTIQTLTKTLDLIEEHINPYQASLLFDSLNRFIMDRVLTPAMKEVPDLKENAQRLAQQQSDINAKVYKLTQAEKNIIPLGPGWDAYKKGIKELLAGQKLLNNEIIAFSEDLPETIISPGKVEETLPFLSLKIEEALTYPTRLLTMKAELTDRLALAYQEAEYWDKAVENFNKAYSLNEQLGLYQNLARNRRSVAYNTYMKAGALSGKEKEEHLHRAAEDFEKTIDLVGHYGVETKKKEDRTFYLFKIKQSMDKGDATEAAYGFTAEQEIRLAQAFLMRIKTERGELYAAQEEVEKQLQSYPSLKKIPDNDVYGVSLLYHRAGHLAAAQKEYIRAFDYFHQSFTLSLSQANTVSSALNVTNMANCICHIRGDEKELPRLVRELDQAHQKIIPLLNDFPALADNPVPAQYSNSMGIYALCMSSAHNMESDLEKASYEMYALQKAAKHFSYGLKWLEDSLIRKDESLIERKNLALMAVLHLNMARVAQWLKETDMAKGHWEKTLSYSQRGLMPHYEWRALTGLGRYEEALIALDTVTILNARCSPQEIMTAFAPLVFEKVKAHNDEEAFNLVEKLSEYERIHRMAGLYESELTFENRKLFKSLTPRLERMSMLSNQIPDAVNQEEADYLQQALKREHELLAAKAGDLNNKLPTFAPLMTNQEVKNQFMFFIGLAQALDDKSNALVKAGNDNSALFEEYKELRKQYNEIKEELVMNAQEDLSVVPLIIPQPIEAIDIIDKLPENKSLVRLFRVNSQEGEFIAFTITRDTITSSLIFSHELKNLSSDKIYLVYENPGELPLSQLSQSRVTYALSGTHLYRSIVNRKPFKSRLLILPPTDKVIENYTKIPLSPEVEDKEVLEVLPRVHTLVIGNKVALTETVPTRAGERPVPVLTMKRQETRTLPLNHFSGSLSNLSLALLSGADLTDTYIIGHLFSVLGSPTVVLSKHPVETSDFISHFLKAYSSQSAFEAFNEAVRETLGSENSSQSTTLQITDSPINQLNVTSSKGWLQLGYRGMAPEEARVFAQKHFAQYVKRAQQASKDENYDNALTLFENSLFIAQQDASFNRYLPDIYRSCRESAYKSGRIDLALDYARSYADLMADRAPDTEAHAEALFLVGVLYAQLENYDKSVAVLDKVREMMVNLEMPVGEINVLSNLGVVFENATEYDRALVQFEKAAKIGKNLEKDELVANQYVNIGRIYDLRLSQYAKAKQNYSQALSLYQDIGSSQEIAQTLLDIGRCERLLGNFLEADRLYSEALSLIKEQSDTERLQVKIMLEQSNNAWFQGRYEEAFNLEKKCYDRARANKWILERVISLNTGGLIWWTLGENKRALRRLEDALELSQTLKARPDEVATTLNNIGLIYRQTGQYNKALETFDKALKIDEKLKSRWAIAYDLRNKGLTFIRMNEPAKAIPLLERAVTETQAIGNRINEAKSLLALGTAQKDLGDNQKAQTTLEHALELARSMVLRETQWRCLYELSLISLHEGEQEKARKLLTEAAHVIEDMRSDIKIDQLKNGFITDKMAVYETLVVLLVDQGRTTEAFEVAERSRARNFIDLLGNQRLSLKGSVEQKLYDRERTLKARIIEHEKLLAQATDDQERQVYRKALDNLNDDHRDLMLQIQIENPQLTTLVSVDPLNLKDIQRLLDPNVALLVYYVVPDEIISWLVKSNEMKLYRKALGRDTLDKAIMEYRRLIQNLEPLQIESKELFNWLVADKIPDLSQVRYLGIVPHGKLHYLSFATLSDENNYLVDKYPHFYLPSASLMRYTLSRRSADKMTKVLAIGNPELNDPALALPFAEREVRSIKWNFPDITILTGEKATETWIVNNIDKFGIIHLASHGEFDPINPLFSSIKLAGDEQKDGDLDAFEVFNLRINSDLVMLSACQTGLGKITRADEVIGLNRSFFYAGTHALISSLWRVSDTSTALLSKNFYRQYIQKNKAESLRSAMLHVKNQYPHPGYWGAFTLVGDYY
jgi:CHAT domain-containing protein